MLRNTIRSVLNIQASAAPFLHQVRTTVVVRRKEIVVRNKKEEKLPPERNEHFYIIEEHSDLARRSNIDVILQHNIEGVGRRYEVVNVTRSLARNKLLLSGAAIYASPSNLEANRLNAQKVSTPQQSVNAQRSLRQLKAMTLRVYMNENSSWTLAPKHLRIAFRKQGVIVPESAIELLETDIISYGRIEFNVTVNELTKVKVQADIYPYGIDHSETPAKCSVFNKHKIPIGTILQ